MAALIDVEDLEAELLGEAFPSGEFTITDWEHWLCADAIQSPNLGEGVAHPMYAYYVAIRGMGPSLDQIFTACHSSADAGVMFGEAGLDLHVPMRIGTTYRVEGEFTKVVRKESSRLGIMDLITFDLELYDEDDNHVATSSNTFVYPRGSAAESEDGR